MSHNYHRHIELNKDNGFIFLKPYKVRIFFKGDKVKTINDYKGVTVKEATVLKVNKKGFNYLYLIKPADGKRRRWISQPNLELTPEQKTIEAL